MVTFNKLIKKIKDELNDKGKIVDYNSTIKGEILMISYKGRLYKKFQYENKLKGSYTGFEMYLPEANSKNN